MFLQPKKTKYKKTRKGKLKKLEFKANTLRFGELGLKAEEKPILTAFLSYLAIYLLQIWN